MPVPKYGWTLCQSKYIAERQPQRVFKLAVIRNIVSMVFPWKGQQKVAYRAIKFKKLPILSRFTIDNLGVLPMSFDH